MIEGLRRELHFMPSARLDGLKLRVEEFGKNDSTYLLWMQLLRLYSPVYSLYHDYQCLPGKKTTQYYDGSKDNLIYRSASYKVGAALTLTLALTPTLTPTLSLAPTPTPTLTRLAPLPPRTGACPRRLTCER